MAIDRFFIAPYDKNSGLQTNYRPWLIPDEAFAVLENAYVFRGRVRKRFGSRWFANDSLLSRLAVIVATTDNSGNASGTVPLGSGAIGQGFSIGTNFFTVSGLGTPTTLLATTTIATATFNTSSGSFTFIGATALTPVYWYPSLPVMGLLTMVTSYEAQQFIIGFDTSYAYQYISGWQRLALEAPNNTGASVWTGSDTDFFWGTTWTGTDASSRIFFVTNSNQADGIRYLNATTLQWNYFNYCYSKGTQIGTTDGGGNAFGTVGPSVVGQIFVIGNTVFTATIQGSGAFSVSSLNTSATVGTGTFDTTNGNYTFASATASSAIYEGTLINSALIILPFKNRLILLNTIENGLPYVNRCRYSQVGSPLDPAGWLQDVPGRGNAIDASTTEAIISAEFIKDRLIVYFEYSTWELAYTGNQAYPFTWQKINTELGAESTFSVVPFDKIVLAIDNVGINACNGANVERIDDLIPTTVFTIHNGTNDEGMQRVYGIRDYYLETVYWTFPDATQTDSTPYPNKVLVYNYKTATWGINDDSITCFGYYQPVSGILWSSQTVTWTDQIEWASGATQAFFKEVVAGNQQGYTFLCDEDCTTNASVIQITNISVSNNTVTVTAVNHNFEDGGYLYFQGIVDTGNIGTFVNNTIWQITSITGINTFTFAYIDELGTQLSGIYKGGGLISTVSNITVTTKQYNFYAKDARNAYISQVDFMIDSTPAGQIDVNYYASTSVAPLLQESAINGCILGTGTLDTYPYPTIPFEQTASRLWHPLYLQGEGECIQLQLTMNGSQLKNIDIWQSDFQLHAMIIFATPTSSRLR